MRTRIQILRTHITVSRLGVISALRGIGVGFLRISWLARLLELVTSGFKGTILPYIAGIGWLRRDM